MIDSVLFNTPQKKGSGSHKSAASSMRGSVAQSAKKSSSTADDYGMGKYVDKAANRYQMTMLRKAMQSTWHPDQMKINDTDRVKVGSISRKMQRSLKKSINKEESDLKNFQKPMPLISQYAVEKDFMYVCGNDTHSKATNNGYGRN